MKKLFFPVLLVLATVFPEKAFSILNVINRITVHLKDSPQDIITHLFGEKSEISVADLKKIIEKHNFHIKSIVNSEELMEALKDFEENKVIFINKDVYGFYKNTENGDILFDLNLTLPNNNIFIMRLRNYIVH